MNLRVAFWVVLMKWAQDEGTYLSSYWNLVDWISIGVLGHAML